MKIGFLLISFFLLPFSPVEAALEIGTYKIPEALMVDSQIVVAGTYGVRIDDSSDRPFIELVKGENVVAKAPAIVLPARGSATTSVVAVKTGKRELIRIRARGDDKWYIVYFPVQPPAISSQH
jgi:hypothetical protein